MGARAEEVSRLDQLGPALQRSRESDRTSVIVMRTDPDVWTEGDAWWDVGVPEVSDREEVRAARAEHDAERRHQRPGV
jgi:3D-(3,5/4)-trihydroxycyclohexane-1,2-dione acylhydrolase (decyclizing)